MVCNLCLRHDVCLLYSADYEQSARNEGYTDSAPGRGNQLHPLGHLCALKEKSRLSGRDGECAGHRFRSHRSNYGNYLSSTTKSPLSAAKDFFLPRNIVYKIKANKEESPHARKREARAADRRRQGAHKGSGAKGNGTDTRSEKSRHCKNKCHRHCSQFVSRGI